MNDPNIDMTGWDFDDNCVESVEKLRLRNPKKGERVYLISVNEGQMEGGEILLELKNLGLLMMAGLSSPPMLRTFFMLGLILMK